MRKAAKHDESDRSLCFSLCILTKPSLSDSSWSPEPSTDRIIWPGSSTMRTRQLMVGWYESGLESDAFTKATLPFGWQRAFPWWSARLAGNTAACPRWPNAVFARLLYTTSLRTEQLCSVFSRACQLWSQNRIVL